MTSEEIKKEDTQLPGSDPVYAIAEWLQEIAYQFAVMNERNANDETAHPTHRHFIPGGGLCGCSLCNGGNLG